MKYILGNKGYLKVKYKISDDAPQGEFEAINFHGS